MEAHATVLNTNDLDKSNKSNRHKILVVEDDFTFEIIWNHIIKRADHTAIMEITKSASDASEKIRLAEKNGFPFSLIISDIFLSGAKTGLDLWFQFHDQFHEKFILVSAVTHLSVMKYFNGLDSPMYLQKPLVIPDAIGTVHELLKKHED